MSTNHDKKKHNKTHDDSKTKKTDRGDDKGKLSDAMKNKSDGDDDDEMTPGFQPVTPDMPTDIQADLVGAQDAGTDLDGNATCKVIAGVGSKEGVVEEMQAYLLMNDGEKLAFNINTVGERGTVGTVEGSKAYLMTHSKLRIVINPSTHHDKKSHKKKHHHH